MFERQWITILAIAAIFALAGVFAAPRITSAADPEAATTSQEVAETQELKQLTGRIVDAHSYVFMESSADQVMDANGVRAWFAPDAPIALLPDEGRLQKLIPGTKLHLIVYDHQDGDAKAAYASARNLIGEQVVITGTMHSRGGLDVFSIKLISQAPQPAVEDSAAAPVE